MLRVSIRRVALSLLLVALVFVPLSLYRTPIRQFIEDVLPYEIQVDRLLRMGGEGSLSAWYATSLFLAALGLTRLVKRTATTVTQRHAFTVVTLLVLLLALDQSILLHERLLAMWHTLAGSSLAWLPVVAALALVLLRRTTVWAARAQPYYLLAWILIFAGYAWGIVTAVHFPLHRTHEAITTLLKMTGAISLIVAMLTHLASVAPSIRLTFTPAPRLLAWLAGLSLLFSLLTAGFYLLQARVDLDTIDPFRLSYLLDSGQEATIPTFYAVFLWRLCAALLICIAIGQRQAGQPYAHRWATLSAVFVYLSLDEASSLHEQLIGISRAVVARLNLDSTGLFYHAWVIPVGLAVLLLFVLYLPFLRRLPRQTALWMLFSGGLFVLGALGLEMVGGVIVTFALENDALRLGVETLEELLEMLALSFFAYTLVRHLAHYVAPLHLRFADAQTPAPSSPARKSLVP